MALDTRPDLRSALQAVAKARTDYRLAIANGSTDPTFGLDFGAGSPDSGLFRRQHQHPAAHFRPEPGRKGADAARHRAERAAGRSRQGAGIQRRRFGIRRAAEQLVLLRPYKTRYLDEAARVRETISFSYQHGGSSLLDFLQAQQDYRSIQLSYLNLVGAYLNAAAQMNLAVGREVIQ